MTSLRGSLRLSALIFLGSLFLFQVNLLRDNFYNLQTKVFVL